MELKNALSVCLIALFSSTLVVLIARTLDSQAANRLEPQLARIATELEAIRAGGGMPTNSASTPAARTLQEGLMVYFFHGNQRCPTCRSIEAQTFSVVQSEFAGPLDKGQLQWQTLNYEDSSGSALAKTFDVTASNVVLAQMTNGEVASAKRLDEVWALVGDPPAFAKFIREEVASRLPAAPAATAPPASAATTDASDIPLPDDEEGA